MGPIWAAMLFDDFVVRWADGTPVTMPQLLGDDEDVQRRAWACVQVALQRVRAEIVFTDTTPSGKSVVGLDLLRPEPQLALAQALGGYEVGTADQRRAVAEVERLLMAAANQGLLGTAVLNHTAQMQAAALVSTTRLLADAAPSVRFFSPPPLESAGVSLLGRAGSPSCVGQRVTAPHVAPELAAKLSAAGADLAAKADGGLIVVQSHLYMRATNLRAIALMNHRVTSKPDVTLLMLVQQLDDQLDSSVEALLSRSVALVDMDLPVAAQSVKAHVQATVAEHEGVELFLSETSRTGYEGVWFRPDRDCFVAYHQDCYVGRYATALAAAVAFARHKREQEQREAAEAAAIQATLTAPRAKRQRVAAPASSSGSTASS